MEGNKMHAEMSTDLQDFSNDHTRKRTIVVGGRKFFAEAFDPYGLWKIIPEKGPVPEMLKGQYTSPNRCVEAIQKYLNTKETKAE